MLKYRNKSNLMSWFSTLLVAVVILVLLDLWRTRNLPDVLPNFQVQTRSGKEIALQEMMDSRKPTLIYLFAPWCQICKLSISGIKEKDSDIHVIPFGFDYENPAEVHDFIRQAGYDGEYILGDRKILEIIGVQSYPAYLFVDAQGKIRFGSVGYMTGLGLKLRTIMLRVFSEYF